MTKPIDDFIISDISLKISVNYSKGDKNMSNNFANLETKQLIMYRKLGMISTVLFAIISLLLLFLAISSLSGGDTFLFTGGLVLFAGSALGGIWSFIYMNKVKKELYRRNVTVQDILVGEALSKKFLKLMIVAVGIPVIIIVPIVLFGAISSTMQDENKSYIECSVCGRTWAAGDEDGNYMSVAKSKMCNRCKSNYESMQGALDYYEQNKEYYERYK